MCIAYIQVAIAIDMLGNTIWIGSLTAWMSGDVLLWNGYAPSSMRGICFIFRLRAMMPHTRAGYISFCFLSGDGITPGKHHTTMCKGGKGHMDCAISLSVLWNNPNDNWKPQVSF